MFKTVANKLYNLAHIFLFVESHKHLNNLLNFKNRF